MSDSMIDSPIVLGLWPIAGITTVGVTPEDARETIEAALSCGITAFDTAYSYGFEGESDRLLGEFLRGRREQLSVIGKVGQRWTPDHRRVVDGSPARLTADAEASLKRLGTGYFDLLLLHSPDPVVPLADSVRSLDELRRRGMCRRIGISNMTRAQMEEFDVLVGCDAIECPLNLVQTSNLEELVRPSAQANRDVFVFWTLMKGLLAGKIDRDHTFAPGDSRPNYPIFQGRLRSAIHDAIDEMKRLAEANGSTVAQLSVGWAISQPGVTAALVGARRAEQIRELAQSRKLHPETLSQIEKLIQPVRSISVDSP